MAVRSQLRYKIKFFLFLGFIFTGHFAWPVKLVSSVSGLDAVGNERAHRMLYPVHIYDNQATPQRISSAAMLAMDSHHFVAPYLSVASSIRHPYKIFTLINGKMTEVALQYIDIFSGTALLYSPTELKDYVQASDLSSSVPNSGDTMKIVAPVGDSIDGTAAFYTGVVSDDVHQVFTLNSPLSFSASKTNGCLLLNKEGKIAGLYQGNSYLKKTESFTLSSSFFYLFKKATTSNVFPTDKSSVQRQLTNQIKALMTRTLASLAKPVLNISYNLSPWSLKKISGYLECEIDEKAIGNTIKCLPRLPLYAEDGVLALNVESSYSSVDSTGTSDLLSVIDSKSSQEIGLFSGRNLACKQQRTSLAPDVPSDDFQVHFCLAKNVLEASNVDLLLRGVSIPKSHKSMYFQFLIQGFGPEQTKKVAKALVDSLQRREL